MAEMVEEQGDRLVLYLDAGGPMELTGLTDSFAALARLYERHYRPDPETDVAPKLFVTKLESGSVLAEIAPYAVLLGQAYPYVAQSVTVANFSKRLIDGVKAFAGITSVPTALPSRDDVQDLRTFIAPLTGKRGATLGVKHAAFYQRDGERETKVEYTFDEVAISRAAINMDRALEALPAPSAEASTRHLSEVLLYFDRASRSPGKERGRPTDWAVVPDVSDKPLPTYFRKGIRGNLKDVMIRGDVNALANVGFIVDVAVQVIDEEPRLYIVTEVHEDVALGDGSSGGA